MFVAIHAHFYQPPRENPWTNEIPRQESAAPFHDWNERITDQCYGPNGFSRVLDAQGRITSIVSNFEHLSFDFGPTLLQDLQRRFPYVYRRILQADRRSVSLHRGHGNGMAQAYNHMILPLANYRDKWTQIRWGQRDFGHRFGRATEGLWLPETACDAETLRVATEAGIRFLILAPRQALRFRKLGETAWRTVSGQHPIDTKHPYRCYLGGAGADRRSIDVFFYDGSLSVAVSFEHLLRGAESFASRLEESGRGRPDGSLVHVATDGEVYGHHEPFADMCLAYLFDHEGPRRGLRFVNYGEMLDLHPPTHEVELNFTETGEGTAWSCAHGVGRWIRDCGCHTGGQEGWNQRWRTPLRRGLDALRDEVQGAYLAGTSPLLRDPWAARDDYIEVLLHPDSATREEFLARHLRGPADPTSRKTVWSLLEATHQAMLMYTSCAWFFADISGLEVQQNLAYAARACELAQPYVSEPLEPLLLRYLEQARSNDSAWGNGAEVYRRMVLPWRIGPEHAAAQAAFEHAILGRPLGRRVYRYVVQGTSESAPIEANSESRGRLSVFDEQVERSWSWLFRVTSGSLNKREVHLTPAVDAEAGVAPSAAVVSLRNLSPEIRGELAQSALRHSLQEEAQQLHDIYERARSPMHLLLELGLPVPEVHQNLASHVLQQRSLELSRNVRHDRTPLPDEWWDEVANLQREYDRLGLHHETDMLAMRLAGRINALLDAALDETDERAALESVASAYETLARADRLRLPLPRTGHEPRAYDLVLRFSRELSEALTSLPDESVEDPPGRVAGPFEGLTALKRIAGHANLHLEVILRDASLQRQNKQAQLVLGGSNRNAKG